MTYQHAEAFCLMKYRADDGSDEELIWNSRDGVTPFVIILRSGKQAKHVEWYSDQRMPEDYKPFPGMRMFVDLTEERAREAAQRNADKWWNDPELGPTAYRQFGTKDAMIDSLAQSYLERPGTPDLVVVKP